MIAHALRERVFELRFPSRMMEIGDDAALVDVFDAALDAPSAEAFVLSLARLFKPALLAAYREYEQLADDLADGPILRALRIAIDEKTEQIAALTSMAQAMLQAAPRTGAPQRRRGCAALGLRLIQAGGVGVAPPQPVRLAGDLPGRRPFQLAEIAGPRPRASISAATTGRTSSTRPSPTATACAATAQRRQPPQRGVGGGNRRRDSAGVRRRAGLGVHLRRRPLDL